MSARRHVAPSASGDGLWPRNTSDILTAPAGGGPPLARLVRFARTQGSFHRLRNLLEVGVVEFEKEDIVRNSVIAHILDRYDD